VDIKQKIQEYIRVLQITKKPSKEEYMGAAKITGLGILFIGAIGFAVLVVAYALGLTG
jgi:protein transport protein SEC61 subunit gamma and related proteins